jgi:hypothetical protein
MPQQPINKQTLKISYLSDLVGADIPRDLIRVSMRDQYKPLDVSAEPIETIPGNASYNGSSSQILNAGSEFSRVMRGIGASTLEGRIDRGKEYSVTVKWVTKAGDIIFEDKKLSGVAGENRFSTSVDYPFAEVVISDDAGLAEPVAYTLNMR